MRKEPSMKQVMGNSLLPGRNPRLIMVRCKCREQGVALGRKRSESVGNTHPTRLLFSLLAANIDPTDMRLGQDIEIGDMALFPLIDNDDPDLRRLISMPGRKGRSNLSFPCQRIEHVRVPVHPPQLFAERLKR